MATPKEHATITPQSAVVVLAADPDFIEGLCELVGDTRVHVCRDLSQALQKLTDDDVELVLVHLCGVELQHDLLLETLATVAPDVPVVAIAENAMGAADAMAAGAAWCVPQSAGADTIRRGLDRVRDR